VTVISDLSQGEFDLFRHLIKKHAGISFSRQKKLNLQRRLAHRVNHLALKSYRAYYRYLLRGKEGGRELQKLINSITIHQTAFFRHSEQFELLAGLVLPQVMAGKKTVKTLRIWSAGCATGQEVYSIAMTVREMFEGDSEWDIKILGTDIGTDVLKLAYQGRYAAGDLKEVPSEYLEKYFRIDTGEKGESYAITESLKENILFRRLNFIESRFPFSNPVDIIFCRNVMIYFDPEDKRKLIDRFFRLLAPDGFLFLGASESLIGIDKRFTLVSHSIYQKTG
jgi:chemotaxis protein methyltransferase CheR